MAFTAATLAPNSLSAADFASALQNQYVLIALSVVIVCFIIAGLLAARQDRHHRARHLALYTPKSVLYEVSVINGGIPIRNAWTLVLVGTIYTQTILLTRKLYAYDEYRLRVALPDVGDIQKVIVRVGGTQTLQSTFCFSSLDQE